MRAGSYSYSTSGRDALGREEEVQDGIDAKQQPKALLGV